MDCMMRVMQDKMHDDAFHYSSSDFSLVTFISLL